MIGNIYKLYVAYEFLMLVIKTELTQSYNWH